MKLKRFFSLFLLTFAMAATGNCENPCENLPAPLPDECRLPPPPGMPVV